MRVFEDLARGYAEPHRKYHTLEHIDECLKVFDRFRHLAKKPDSVELAVYIHDRVYDIGVQPRYNEWMSIVWACRYMDELRIDPKVTAEVCAYILATTHDHVPDFDDGKLMVDIDLAGLGAPWETFLRNNQNVRQEYSTVPENVFLQKNRELLGRFLARQPLYYFPEIEAVFGAQARDNLRRLLNRS